MDKKKKSLLFKILIPVVAIAVFIGVFLAVGLNPTYGDNFVGGNSQEVSSTATSTPTVTISNTNFSGGDVHINVKNGTTYDFENCNFSGATECSIMGSMSSSTIALTNCTITGCNQAINSAGLIIVNGGEISGNNERVTTDSISTETSITAKGLTVQGDAVINNSMYLTSASYGFVYEGGTVNGLIYGEPTFETTPTSPLYFYDPNNESFYEDGAVFSHTNNSDSGIDHSMIRLVGHTFSGTDGIEVDVTTQIGVDWSQTEYYDDTQLYVRWDRYKLNINTVPSGHYVGTAVEVKAGTKVGDIIDINTGWFEYFTPTYNGTDAYANIGYSYFYETYLYTFGTTPSATLSYGFPTGGDGEYLVDVDDYITCDTTFYVLLYDFITNCGFQSAKSFEDIRAGGSLVIGFPFSSPDEITAEQAKLIYLLCELIYDPTTIIVNDEELIDITALPDTDFLNYSDARVQLIEDLVAHGYITCEYGIYVGSAQEAYHMIEDSSFDLIFSWDDVSQYEGEDIVGGNLAEDLGYGTVNMSDEDISVLMNTLAYNNRYVQTSEEFYMIATIDSLANMTVDETTFVIPSTDNISFINKLRACGIGYFMSNQTTIHNNEVTCLADVEVFMDRNESSLRNYESTGRFLVSTDLMFIYECYKWGLENNVYTTSNHKIYSSSALAAATYNGHIYCEHIISLDNMEHHSCTNNYMFVYSNDVVLDDYGYTLANATHLSMSHLINMIVSYLGTADNYKDFEEIQRRFNVDRFEFDAFDENGWTIIQEIFRTLLPDNQENFYDDMI